jgi:splicing factor, arginine/serine-rich 4/5/6
MVRQQRVKRNLETPCSFFSLDVSILGYAFIYFEDERDAEDAIRRLDNVSFGYSRRRLSVEWSRVNPFLYLERYFCQAPGVYFANHHHLYMLFVQHVEPVLRSRDRPTGDVKPTRTLFIIIFDPIRTKIQDIERHFEPYGKIINIRIRRNFAFVQYKTLEESSAAVKKTDKRYVSLHFHLSSSGH